MKMNNLEERITALEGQVQELLKQVCILIGDKLSWQPGLCPELNPGDFARYKANIYDMFNFYRHHNEANRDIAEAN